MTIQQAFEVALQRHQSGGLAEAEALYRQIVAVDPRHADAQKRENEIQEHHRPAGELPPDAK